MATCPRCSNPYEPPKCKCGFVGPPAPKRPAPLLARNVGEREVAALRQNEQAARKAAIGHTRYPLYRTDTRLLRELTTSHTDHTVKFPPPGFNPYVRTGVHEARRLLREKLDQPSKLKNLLTEKIYGNLVHDVAKKLVSTSTPGGADNPGGQRGTTPLQPWSRFKPVYQILVPGLLMVRVRDANFESACGVKSTDAHRRSELAVYMNAPRLDVATVFGVALNSFSAPEVTMFTGIPEACIYLFLDGENPAGLHHYSSGVRWGTR